MELRQLKYFVATAETLNFSEAARNLCVTQSTLSQQIKQLENELGVELFQRDSHNVRLTESGEYILPSAKKTLFDADTCFTQIRDLRQMLAGELRVGITYSFAPIISDVLKDYTKEYPGIKLNIVYRNMEVILEMLKKRDLDCVLSFRPNKCDSEIESHRLFDDQLCAVMKADHPLAGKKILTFDDIKTQRLAMPSADTQARNVFESCFPGKVAELNVQVEMNAVYGLLDLVNTTQMISFLSEAATSKAKGVKTVPLDSPFVKMEGCVHLLKNTYRKRAIDEFIRILNQSNALILRANNWLK